MGWIPSVEPNQTISSELGHLILNLLAKKEEERLSWNELIDHEFFGEELVDRITFKINGGVDVETQTKKLFEKQQQQAQQQQLAQQQVLLQTTLSPKQPTFSVLNQHTNQLQKDSTPNQHADIKNKDTPPLKKLSQPGSLLKQRAEKPTQHQLDFLPQRFMQHNQQQGQSIMPDSMHDQPNGFSNPCFTKLFSDLGVSCDEDTLRQTIRDSIINFRVVKQEVSENNHNKTKPCEMYLEKLKKQKCMDENKNKIAWQHKEPTIIKEKTTPQNLQIQNSHQQQPLQLSQQQKLQSSQQQHQLQLSHQQLQQSQHLPLEQLSKRNTKTKSTFSFRSKRREEEEDEEEILEEIICADEDGSVKSDIDSNDSENDTENSIMNMSSREHGETPHGTRVSKVDNNHNVNEEDNRQYEGRYQEDSDNETLGILPCGDDDAGTIICLLQVTEFFHVIFYKIRILKIISLMFFI